MHDCNPRGNYAHVWRPLSAYPNLGSYLTLSLFFSHICYLCLCDQVGVLFYFARDVYVDVSHDMQQLQPRDKPEGREKKIMATSRIQCVITATTPDLVMGTGC